MAGFHHADHLQLAIDYLREADSFETATARMAATLREKATAAGAPEKYHQTVTVFWMRLVAWMLDKDLPRTFYSAAALASVAARLGWLEPDLRPMPDEPVAATPLRR